MVKTRMQLQLSTTGERAGLVGTGAGILRNEGVLALWSGVTPAIMRGVVFGGMRLGSYGPIKRALNADESFGRKVAAGTLAGGLSATICSPTELLKTRMQSAAGAGKSTLQVVREVVEADGFKGLYRGAVPGLVRSSVLTASQCATYDEVKGRLMAATGAGDSVGVHLGTAMVTGLVTTTATNWCDVVKTHMFVGGSKFSGPFACAADVYRRGGLRGFMRGWTASYARLGPQIVVTFLVAEKLRKLVGMESF